MHGRVNHSRTARPESLFRRLGKQHADIRRSDDSIFRSPLASDITKRLRRIYRHLLTSETIRELQPLASEWFLDNYHVLLDAAAVSHEGLVPDFYERLPDVADAPRDGTPRVFLLARELLVASELRIDEADAAQLPVCISTIRATHGGGNLGTADHAASGSPQRRRIVHGETPAGRALPDDDVLAGCAQPDMDEETTISRVIRALSLIADINWNAFFDSVSRLEAELTQDPAGIYAKMDFRTRDRYRKIVEELAWHTGSAEIDVARDVLTTAARAPSSDERRRHIGYYLIDRGRDQSSSALWDFGPEAPSAFAGRFEDMPPPGTCPVLPWPYRPSWWRRCGCSPGMSRHTQPGWSSRSSRSYRPGVSAWGWFSGW